MIDAHTVKHGYCPGCHVSNAEVVTRYGTLMAIRDLMVDGVFVRSDPNIYTTEYRCLNCDAMWREKTQNARLLAQELLSGEIWEKVMKEERPKI